MLSEGAELVGESGRTYTAVSDLGQANVWVAAEKGNTSNIVVLKEPDPHEPAPWPKFVHEMIMHETFKNCPSIRKQVDRVPPSQAGAGPTLVLEMFETTVWSARTKRPMTLLEIKAITKAALLGLKDVHAQGLVYADLKMQNIMLNGFDTTKPGPPDALLVKLGDLGTVMEPDKGQVQPVVYRAPEVYFKGEITPKADIWGWGLIYCHLLEAQHHFSTTGMYDDLDIKTGSTRDRMDAVRYAIANDYEVHGEPYFREVALPKQDHRGKGTQWEDLRKKGLEQSEVDFLRWVMRADPRKRPTAEQILASGWLDKSEEEIAAAGGGFTVPLDPAGHATIEFDPRRPKPSEAKKKATTSRMSGMTTAYEDDAEEEEPSWRAAITKAVPSALSDVFGSSSPGFASGPYTPGAAGKEVHPSAQHQSQPPQRPGLEATPSWREAIAKNVPSTSSASNPWSSHASPSHVTPGPWTPNTAASGTHNAEHNPFGFSPERHFSPASKRHAGDPSLHVSSEDSATSRRSSRDIVNSLISGSSVPGGSFQRQSLDWSGRGSISESGHASPAVGGEQTTSSSTETKTEGRPGLPSRNTGTYLSYRG